MSASFQGTNEVAALQKQNRAEQARQLPQIRQRRLRQGSSFGSDYIPQSASLRSSFRESARWTKARLSGMYPALGGLLLIAASVVAAFEATHGDCMSSNQVEEMDIIF
jgi:hypothetical protein